MDMKGEGMEQESPKILLASELGQIPLAQSTRAILMLVNEGTSSIPGQALLTS